MSGTERTAHHDLLGEAVDASSDCVFLVELDSTVVAANAATSTWLGVPAAALLGRRLGHLADRSPTAARNADLLATMPDFLPRVWATGSAFSEDEMSFFAVDGSIRVASVRIDPLALAGRPPRLLCTFRFLDERRALFRASTVGMARLTLAGAVMQANRAFERLVGRPEVGLTDRSVEGLVVPEHAQAWRKAVARTAGGGGEQVTEQRMGGAGGVWTRCTLTVVPGVTEFDGFLLSVWEDVSERRAAQAALQRREDTQRLLATLGSLAVSAEQEEPFLATVRDEVRRALRRQRAAEPPSATQRPPAPVLSHRHDGMLVASPPPAIEEEAEPCRPQGC